MSVYYTDKAGRVHCYDPYRLRELGLPADMRESTEEEIQTFQLFDRVQRLEAENRFLSKLVCQCADQLGIEWRQ